MQVIILFIWTIGDNLLGHNVQNFPCRHIMLLSYNGRYARAFFYIIIQFLKVGWFAGIFRRLQGLNALSRHSGQLGARRTKYFIQVVEFQRWRSGFTENRRESLTKKTTQISIIIIYVGIYSKTLQLIAMEVKEFQTVAL